METINIKTSVKAYRFNILFAMCVEWFYNKLNIKRPKFIQNLKICKITVDNEVTIQRIKDIER